jgi:putative FmdB family regulatory protein
LDEELEMPLYDYRCATCGDFRAWRHMSAAAEPADCPRCAAPAARAVVAPSLALMNGHSRIAHQRNEKSAHEPQVMSRGELGHGHHHGHGGAHHQQQHGSGHRPWMIGH